MKILFNITNNSSYGGLQVVLSLLKEFCGYAEKGGLHIVLVTAEKHTLRALLTREITSSAELITIPYFVSSLKTRMKMQSRLDQIVENTQTDIVFTPFGPSYWTPRCPHLLGFALGQIIYRDSPVFRKMNLKQKIRDFLEFMVYKQYYLKKNSRFFWCETSDVKSRLLKQFHLKDEQVAVAGNCCGKAFVNFSKDMKQLNCKDPHDEIRLLCPCSANIHKNLEILREILLLPGSKGIQFSVTLPDGEYERLFGSRNPRIVNLGVLSPERCPEAYWNCDAVFVPSLMECFTANYPEAMVMNRPIITTDLSFARNLCGESALYFDPLSAKDALKQINRLRISEELRNNLTKAGLCRLQLFPSPRKRMEILLRFMNQIIATKNR